MRNQDYNPDDYPADPNAPIIQPFGLVRLAIVVAFTTAMYFYGRTIWGLVF